MNKIFYILFIIFFFSGCSLNSSSKFWSTSKKIDLEENLNQKKNKTENIFTKQKVLIKEFNQNLEIKLNNDLNIINLSNVYSNNDGIIKFNGNLNNISKYKFSKIKNFYKYDPEIIFESDNIIFFENKGSILKFDKNSKLIWKKNFYSNSEKKLNPVIQLANNKKFLIAADNIAKYYMIDIENGELIWLKNNIAPFNSEIKIYEDKFFIVDFSNTLRCFSLKDGSELWNIKTQNSLIRSQKKLSIVIVKDKIFFNNSVGDISAVDLNSGELLWQIPTQNSLIYESTFSLESSNIIANDNTLFFSNNKNQFFSLDIETGSFNWETKINSNLKPTLVGDLLFTISLEGYLFVIDKFNGNILRVTYLFDDFKIKTRKLIKPTGFILGNNKIYVSTNNGRLLVVDMKSGKTTSILKIDNGKILRSKIFNDNLFVVKDNAIIKLD